MIPAAILLLILIVGAAAGVSMAVVTIARLKADMAGLQHQMDELRDTVASAVIASDDLDLARRIEGPRPGMSSARTRSPGEG